MRESDIEKAFVEAIREAGGCALKLTSQTMNGLPDRLVLLFPGKTAFVELKAPGKQMRLLQRKRRKQLETLGFPVFCIDRMEQIPPAVEALKTWSPGEPFPSGIGAKIPDMPKVTLADGASLQEPEIHEEMFYGGSVIGGTAPSDIVFTTAVSEDDDTFTAVTDISDDSGGEA